MHTSLIMKTVSILTFMLLFTACHSSQKSTVSADNSMTPDKETNQSVAPLGKDTTTPALTDANTTATLPAPDTNTTASLPTPETNTTGQEVNQTQTPPSAYTVHKDITATLFWIGEDESPDNHQITNVESAWDDTWLKHYGGIDTPERSTLFPDFSPKENPFYFALPYSDFDDNGNRRDDAMKKIPWAGEKTWSDEVSMVKNRWIKITAANGKTVYAQWEDAGPFEYDDTDYVFGTGTPKNADNNHAGLDLSPAVWIYLGYDTQNADNSAKMSWQFIDQQDVPNGPWMEVVTYRQVSWQ